MEVSVVLNNLLLPSFQTIQAQINQISCKNGLLAFNLPEA